MKKKKPSPEEAVARLEEIKKLAVISMFSDDELMSHLVLKGGNAMDLVLKLSTRSSVDIDFSMANDFPTGLEDFAQRITKALVTTYAAEGYTAFDIKLAERPEHLSDDLRGFWGGYLGQFKLIESERAAEIGEDLEKLRRNAINLGVGTNFTIDISRCEYVEGKVETEYHGYQIFVYSVPMIICEKLRAICQQLPEYSPIVKRENRPGAPRARDFLDIYSLIEVVGFDLTTEPNRELLRNIFDAKKVPLSLLRNLESHREFHRQDFRAVQDTVKPGVDLQPFDYYFDYVLGVVAGLEPLGDE